MVTIALIFSMIFFYHLTEALIVIGGAVFLYVWKPASAVKVFKFFAWIIIPFFAYLILLRDIAPWLERVFA